MVVVKLGGSLAKAGVLPLLLVALEAAKGPAVIVPGGGAFADAVRAEQVRLGFSDKAAHHMALLAMEQYGLLLADLAPRLVPCRSLEEMHRTFDRGSSAVWLPAAMALADATIPQSWDVTSDSLSAWLARRLGATRLLLVKSVAAPAALDPAALAAQGLVDPAFPSFVEGAGFTVEWLGPGEEERLAERLAA
jgi:dihydroneopterin aldolase